MEQERLVRAEKNIENLCENQSMIEKRVTNHGNEIDTLRSGQNKMEQDMALMKKDLEFMTRSTGNIENIINKVDGKLDKMREQRDEDHLSKPLDFTRKITWQAVAIIIAFIVGVLLKNLFPIVQ